MPQDDPNQGLIPEREIRPYELFMLMLCVYSLFSLAVETFFHLPADEIEILDIVDNLVCGIFLLDFFTNLARAKHKLGYLKWGWIDLLSSIPVIDYFRAGRIVRIIRILRVLRGIRIARVLGRYLLRNRADGTILAVIFVSILLLVLSSVAILQVEQKVEGANIQSASDALWWAVATMTTVGYGDKFPITNIGRLIASVLMVSGVGLFGTLSGFVTSWILNPVEERQEIDLGSIHEELAAIQQRLDQVVAAGSLTTDPQLLRFIEAWPRMREAKRSELLQLIEGETD